jgi:hypothetical protein
VPEVERLLAEILAAIRAGGAPVKPVKHTDLQVSKRSPQLEKALAWLKAHPGHLDTPSRQLQAVIGVSHTTVNKAQRLLKEAGQP